MSDNLVMCLLCGRSYKMLGRHLVAVHNITSKEYKESNPGTQTVSEETGQRISKSKRGSNHPMFGRELTSEHRRKISEAKLGQKASPEAKQNMSESTKAWWAAADPERAKKRADKELQERRGIKNGDLIECLICGCGFRGLCGHLRVHNITVIEYKAQFPSAQIVSKETAQQTSETRLVYFKDPKNRQKLSESKKAWWAADPERAKSMSERVKAWHAVHLGGSCSGGYKHTLEARRRISAAMSGSRNPSYGREVSAKTRQKLAEGTRAFAATHPDRQRGSNNPSWLNGISFLPYGPEFTKKFKASIRARDGHRCMLCGANAEEAGGPLHVHHIDYDKLNGSPSNLITLCNRCHSLTTNGDRVYWQKRLTNLMLRLWIIGLDTGLGGGSLDSVWPVGMACG